VIPRTSCSARGPRLRLDGEVLRDQALALGGLLVPTIGGAPVRPYQPINIWQPVAFGGSNTKTYVQDHGCRALPPQPLHVHGSAPRPPRRSPPSTRRHGRTTCVGRGRSNTPLQALGAHERRPARSRPPAPFRRAPPRGESPLTPSASPSPSAASPPRVPDDTERALLTEELARDPPRAHFAARRRRGEESSPAANRNPLATAARARGRRRGRWWRTCSSISTRRSPATDAAMYPDDYDQLHAPAVLRGAGLAMGGVAINPLGADCTRRAAWL